MELHVISAINFHFNINDIRRLSELNKIRISDDDIYKVYEYSGGWIKGIIILLETYVAFKAVKVTDQYKNMIHQDVFSKLEKVFKQPYAICRISNRFMSICLHILNNQKRC